MVQKEGQYAGEEAPTYFKFNILWLFTQLFLFSFLKFTKLL
jgi:hypothetical protein